MIAAVAVGVPETRIALGLAGETTAVVVAIAIITVVVEILPRIKMTVAAGLKSALNPVLSRDHLFLTRMRAAGVRMITRITDVIGRVPERIKLIFKKVRVSALFYLLGNRFDRGGRQQGFAAQILVLTDLHFRMP